MMKRWWVFGYDCYYPGGGISDFVGAFSTREEATAVIKSGKRDYYDLVYIQDDGMPLTIDG